MALVPWNDPNLDRILDRAYENYTDRLLEEAYADRGERCRNCYHFVPTYGDRPNFCNIGGIEDEDYFDDVIDEYLVYDPDNDCCEDWEWNGYDDEPEVDY